jgi:xanthine dehydrogenase YagS FAD-binding subunit
LLKDARTSPDNAFKVVLARRTLDAAIADARSTR